MMQLFLFVFVSIHMLSNGEALGKGGDSEEYLSFRANGVSGEMRVEEQTKNLIRVSQLAEGDIIRGITGGDRTPAWCKVVAVFPVPNSEAQITYDGFTAGQMVVDRTVHPYGANGTLHEGPVFTLVTECDTVVNSADQAFTPLSTTFCPHELSWSDYRLLIAAIRRVIDLTGNFWFDLSVYHDNETAMVPHWFNQLHQICQELLECARQDFVQCLKLQEVIVEFTQNYLNKKYAQVIQRALANMGGDTGNDEAATTTEEIRPRRAKRMLLLTGVGAAMLLLGLVLVVSMSIYRRRMTRKVTHYSLVNVRM